MEPRPPLSFPSPYQPIAWHGKFLYEWSFESLGPGQKALAHSQQLKMIAAFTNLKAEGKVTWAFMIYFEMLNIIYILF